MADAPIFIDPAKCKGCAKCVKGCGFGALKMVDAPGANKAGKLAEVDPSACKACFACIPACPFKAISEVKQEIYGTANIEKYKNIWVFAEQTGGTIAEVAFELLAKALEPYHVESRADEASREIVPQFAEATEEDFELENEDS